MKVRVGTYEMHDTLESQPAIGEVVQVLSEGGTLIRHVWRDLDQYCYDAWIGFPKIPDSVKIRRLHRARSGRR